MLLNRFFWDVDGQVMVLGNFLCQNVLLIRIVIRQRPTMLAVGAGGGASHLSLLYHTISVFFLWAVARYFLKCCLKGPLHQKQPVNFTIRKLIMTNVKKVHIIRFP